VRQCGVSCRRIFTEEGTCNILSLQNKMSSVPTDQKLYNSVKARVYKSNPIHSAYRSGHVVQAYKRAFARKHGSSRSPYRGSRSRSRKGSRSRSRKGSRSRSRKGSRSRSRSTGLGRWFAERWRNQRGEVGYKYKGDVYRPTRRITKKDTHHF
jgi:hypothetical protein